MLATVHSLWTQTSTADLRLALAYLVAKSPKVGFYVRFLTALTLISHHLGNPGQSDSTTTYYFLATRSIPFNCTTAR